MTDYCPTCPGTLRITDATRINWVARCDRCGRQAQLDNNFDWQPHHWWNHPYLYVGLFAAILILVAFLEARGIA